MVILVFHHNHHNYYQHHNCPYYTLPVIYAKNVKIAIYYFKVAKN